MIPFVHLATAPLPGGGELKLFRRGDEFSIMLGGNELMNSRLSGSEEAMARLAAERLGHAAKPEILIGGLGMGFTLRAALAALPPMARITVAELLPAVVEWARGPLAGLFAGSLEDPRVAIHAGDVGALIGAARDSESKWDAILLDVDNGPEGLTVPANDALYSAAGLARAHAALRPGGVLAVWSAQPDAAFARRLRAAGFAVEQVKVRARGTKGAKHVVWVGVKG